MKDVFRYSFPDIPLYKFVYDENTKMIEMYFEQFCDGDILENNCCVFVVKNWKCVEAKELEKDNKSYDYFLKHVGVPDLIFDIVIEDENLTIHLCTKDDRFVSWKFYRAEWELRKISGCF